jgi:hypothetical protein
MGVCSALGKSLILPLVPVGRCSYDPAHVSGGPVTPAKGETMVLLRTSFLTVALCVFSCAAAGRGQDAVADAAKVDIGGFVKEVMKIKIAGDNSELAMWFPFEFFVQSALTEKGMTRERAEADLAMLKPYQIVIVQCGTDNIMGLTKYVGEKDVRSRAVILLTDGTELKPIEKAPPMVNVFMAAMKAMIGAEGDAGSENMHVLVYSGKDKNGKPIIDTSKQDKLTLLLKPHGAFKKTVFTWRTPFDATTQVPPCAKCKEPVSAKWQFCPYCGSKQPARN